MSSSIDMGTLCLGALVGIGCRKQLKAAAKVAANCASSLATTAAITVNAAAAEINGQKTAVGQGQNPNGKNG